VRFSTIDEKFTEEELFAIVGKQEIEEKRIRKI
jgi:hypothetical protein